MTRLDLLKRVINKADPDTEGNMTVKTAEEWLR